MNYEQIKNDEQQQQNKTREKIEASDNEISNDSPFQQQSLEETPYRTAGSSSTTSRFRIQKRLSEQPVQTVS